MFPLKDENPTELVPFVTAAVIAINVAVWLFVQHAGSGEAFLDSLCRYGAIPGEIAGRIPLGSVVPLGEGGIHCETGGLVRGSLLTSMFMHGSWMHLIGNMWFLWVFGNNIEDSMGHLRFVLFYLVCGLVAALAHVVTDLSSPIPTVGASGAISGVMGAYIVLYPRVRVLTLIFLGFFVQLVYLPAVFLLGLWLLLQLGQGLLATTAGASTGVAFWAHVGGFVAGVALIPLFGRAKLVEAKREGRRLGHDELGGWDRW